MESLELLRSRERGESGEVRQLISKKRSFENPLSENRFSQMGETSSTESTSSHLTPKARLNIYYFLILQSFCDDRSELLTAIRFAQCP